jgi:hypothetical protein
MLTLPYIRSGVPPWENLQQKDQVVKMPDGLIAVWTLYDKDKKL